MAKVSKYGQWKYPGEDTIVPTPDGGITMQGVPYPVLGIDNQGNQQMMMPGGEYQFPGNSVYEIPMMKYGGDISTPSLKRVRIKSLPKAQTEGQVSNSNFQPSYDVHKSIDENKELNRRARDMGWNSVAEYEASGWGRNGYVKVPDVVRQQRIAKGVPANQIPEYEKIEEKKPAENALPPKGEWEQLGYENKFYSYKNDPEFFDSHTRFSDNPKYNDWIRKTVYSGKWEYNPVTGESRRVGAGQEAEVSPETKTLAKDVRTWTKEEKLAHPNSTIQNLPKTEVEQLRKEDASFDQYVTNLEKEEGKRTAAAQSKAMVNNPAFYAPGVVGALVVAPELLAADLFGTGVTAGNLLNAGFFASGIDNTLDANSDMRKSWSKAYNNPTQANLWDATLETGLNSLNFLGAKALPGDIAAFRNAGNSAGKFLTTQTPLKNTFKYNPWAWKPNPEAYYHRTPNPANIINTEKGMLQGFGQSAEGAAYNELAIPGKGPGFVTDKGVQTGLNLRKAAHSENYFSKGVPLDFGRYNKGTQGYRGPYIAEVEGVPFVAKANGKFTKVLDPVTGQYTRGIYPPSFEGGYAVAKGPIPLTNTKFYKEDWLRGYKAIETPKVLPGSPNSNQYQIRGLAGPSTKTGLTEENVAAAIEREKQWIQSDEYLTRRAANTGETVEQIKADVAKILSTAEDARFNLNANITPQGQMTSKSLFQKTPTVEIAKHANNPINTLEHETAHLYSPSVHNQTDAALHKGMLEADVASLPASERGVYANYPTLGKGFDKTTASIDLGAKENYLNLGYEQQVRHLNARADILKANNLPLEAELTEAEVKPFVDTWAEKINKISKDPQNPDLIKNEMDYDEIWLEEALKIRENLLKEYGVAADSELNAAQALEYRRRTKEELTKVITDVLNKAWVALPAGIGAGAAMEQKKRGGAVNAISKYKNKFASKVNNDLPIAQDLGTFKRKQLTQTKLNIPAEFQNNTQLDAWVGMPQQSGLGDFTTHRVPSIYDAVMSGNPSSMEEAVDKYLGYPMDKAYAAADRLAPEGEDPIDSFRHPTAAMYTQQAIKDKIGIPIIGDALGFLGANAMGLGHEVNTLFRDKRPWDIKLREAGEDAFNNFTGSVVGLLPGTQDQKANLIYDMSLSNWLPDGVVSKDPNKNMYLKDEQGNVRRSTPVEMYNKKQGGSKKKEKGFQVLTDANGKYVFVKT